MMSDNAILVEHLSKLYHIGKRLENHATLRDQIDEALATSIRRLCPSRNGSSSDGRHRPGAKPMEGTIWALKDVSFQIEPGEIVGIIGRNGAGKSTLLKILSRITEPTEGYAEINGRVGTLLEVGTGFHPELTGRENIYLNGAILGMKKAEVVRKFDEIVSFAEIEKFIDTPVKRYSSGMYMRLAFAVAAHLDPEILIVDEVLAVGDAAFQKKCLGKMGDVAKQGQTVLFVSHNMAAIQALCETGIVLERGTIATLGSIAEVVYAYQNSLGNFSSASIQGIRGVKVLATRLTSDSGAQGFTSQSSLIVEMDFYTEIKLPSCFLNLHVEDVEGRSLIHSRTDQFGANPTFDPGIHRVKVEIPRLGLRAGVYTLWFRLYVDCNEVSERADSERLMLEVHGPQTSGLLDVPCRWSWDRSELASPIS